MFLRIFRPFLALTADIQVTYFKLNALNPKDPAGPVQPFIPKYRNSYWNHFVLKPKFWFSSTASCSCNIVLPICSFETKCLDGSGDNCPLYEKCDGWPFFFQASRSIINRWDFINILMSSSLLQLPVLMLMLITLLNDGALISIGYDLVRPSPVGSLTASV